MMPRSLHEQDQMDANRAADEFWGDFEPLSNCCSATVYPDTDICTYCAEHCELKSTQ